MLKVNLICSNKEFNDIKNIALGSTRLHKMLLGNLELSDESSLVTNLSNWIRSEVKNLWSLCFLVCEIFSPNMKQELIGARGLIAKYNLEKFFEKKPL